MAWIGRVAVVAFAVGVAGGLIGPASAVGVSAAPAGDVSVATAPRPPLDSGVGTPITRALFSSPDGSISCRRVYTEMVWVECLLRKTNEVVAFGPDESWLEVPCVAPDQAESCRLSFGMVYIKPATRTSIARFAGAHRVPMERLVQLGRESVPYPHCIADPNLGLSCRTQMDDQVGEQIFFGVAGSIWSCPGYEFVGGSTPIPRGHDQCRVIRP